MSSELYGWVGARDDILSAYATACLEASKDPNKFNHFNPRALRRFSR